jgi:glucose/arabinose dehydrogenase
MKKRIVLPIIAAVLAIAYFGVSAFVQPIEKRDFPFGFTSSEKVEVETLVGNLNSPWSMDFLPDGKIIFTERFGRISLLDGEPRTVGEIEVRDVGESGLLGIAVDPEFEQNNFIYVYYAHDSSNRVSRFVLSDTLQNETVLLDGIPSASIHNGGRIKFGPDEKLYVTTGDATQSSLAQDTNSLAGKILRLNKDGTIPDDNPFGNYVFSYGHRNPQGVAWHLGIGDMYSSEHGPTRNDEINVIQAGKNYGWPIEQCNEPTEVYVKPIACYTDFTLAPSGITFHDSKLYVAGLRGNHLREITLGNDGITITRERELLREYGRIRDVVSDGEYMYVLTSNRDGRGIPRENDDRILKVRISG